MSDLISKNETIDLLYQVFEKYSMATDKNSPLGGFGTELFKNIKAMPTRLGISMNAFYNCANYGTLIHERYGIIVAENGETAPDPLFTEWDRTRRCILKGVRP